LNLYSWTVAGGEACQCLCHVLIDSRWHLSVVCMQCDRLYLKNTMREEVKGGWREFHKESHALGLLSVVLSVIRRRHVRHGREEKWS